MEELKKQLVLYIEPDPMLRRKAERVGEVTPGILAALDGMAEIIGRFDGIGLAGPQVGVLKRIILIDAGTIAAEDGRPMPAERYMRLIDPEIIGYSKETCEREEGCLSLPTIFANVTRPEGIDFEYTDAKGKRIRAKADGLLARCIMHECDHLDGRLFTDYLGPLKRRLIEKKLKKLKIERL